MPSEMRRPGPMVIDSYVTALDRQLRHEMSRVRRHGLPSAWHRLARLVRVAFRPLLQSGAMMLTSLAVIVAVGVAPLTSNVPELADAPLATPSPWSMAVDGGQPGAYLPPEELLTASEAVGRAANTPDTLRVARE